MGFRAGIGESDFRKLRRNNIDIIDKSQLIIDLVKDPARVLLFPRPRRFGKTTNLSMLRYFFENSTEDRTYLFDSMRVWQSPEARAHFQKHPVIWLSMKDVKADNWEDAERDIHKLISELYRSHEYLLEGIATEPSILGPSEGAGFKAVIDRTAESALYHSALIDLSRWLSEHHKTDVVILIDEYDTPIYSAYSRGYYTQMMDFMRAFLGGGLKDNPYLYKGVVTGILRVARESLFSGLNNLAVHSMLDSEYATAFGFTEAEVADICDRLGAPELLEGMRQMYNGYEVELLSNAISIYNPWSVLNCAKDPLHRLIPHWRNTSSDEVLYELMVQKGFALNAAFEHLLAGGEVERPLDDHVVLRDLDSQEDALWSFLWYAGYLKVTRLWMVPPAKVMAAFAIPNLEVKGAFTDVFQSWLKKGLSSSQMVLELVKALLTGDEETIEELLTELLLKHVSLFDPGPRQPEKLYHGLILGLLVQLEGQYEVRSNPESGMGRADLLMRPLTPGKPGVVIELKVLRRSETVATALKKALDQVKERAYATQLEAAGASPIHTYAILFDGKEAYAVSPASWESRFGAA